MDYAVKVRCKICGKDVFSGLAIKGGEEPEVICEECEKAICYELGDVYVEIERLKDSLVRVLSNVGNYDIEIDDLEIESALDSSVKRIKDKWVVLKKAVNKRKMGGEIKL